MKKLLKRLLILLLLLAITDVIVGMILQQVLVHSPDGRYYKTRITLDEATDDIVIFGSSRAEENYAPFVLEDSLSYSVWNAGRGGQSLPFWYALSQGMLSRYSPRMVIINADSYLLSLDLKESFERTGFLRPFYYTNPEIRPLINSISRFERLFMLSRIYAYNSSFYYLFRPYLIRGIDGEPGHKGWKPREGAMENRDSNPLVVNSSDPLNPQTVKLWENFINGFISRGTRVFVVVSPDFNYAYESTSTIEYLQGMKNISFINLGNDLYFSRNYDFYSDPTHLNMQGAIEFSRQLSRHIIQKSRTQQEYLVVDVSDEEMME